MGGNGVSPCSCADALAEGNRPGDIRGDTAGTIAEAARHLSPLPSMPDSSWQGPHWASAHPINWLQQFLKLPFNFQMERSGFHLSGWL